MRFFAWGGECRPRRRHPPNPHRLDAEEGGAAHIRNALPPITPNWDKRVLEAETVSGPVALDEIHVLADTEGAGAADTLMQLVANAYRPDLATPEWQRNEFLTLAETVKATRCSVLKPHEDWRKLPRMLERGNV